MLHSIIIPALNRDRHLAVCLASIHHSARVCQVSNFEIVVAGDTVIRDVGFRLISFKNATPVELGPNEPMPYWKTAAQNTGLASAAGDTLTFLDADAVVAPRWFENLERLEDDALTKLAYRVKYATYTEWGNGHNWLWAFEHYDELAGCGIAFEAYGAADHDWSHRISQGDSPAEEPFGNSHFSIRRDRLGNLRFDERYIGRGYDDIHFNRLIADHYGDAYRCEIVTDGSHALFNIQHPQSDNFCAGPWNERNRRLFYGEPRTYYSCPDLSTAERMLAQDPHCEAVWPGNEWKLSRAVPGLDKIFHIATTE